MKKQYLLLLFMLTTAVSVRAYDLAVANADGVTIYYDYINDKKALSVTCDYEVSYTSLSATYTPLPVYTANKVNIPSTVNGLPVTRIGSDAFYDCNKVSAITLPSSIKEIGTYAFYHCTKLTSLTLPDGLEAIGASAFSRCNSLNSIIIPNSVKTIGEKAFQYCTRLTSITIPSGVTVLYDNVFEYCLSLSKVTDNHTGSIGAWLRSLSALETLEIGSNISNIASDAFFYFDESKGLDYCKALKEINVAEGNPNFTSIDGVLYNKEATQLICYPFGKKDESWNVPTSLTYIGIDFSRTSYLFKEIVFNGTMNSICLPAQHSSIKEPVKLVFKQETAPTIDYRVYTWNMHETMTEDGQFLWESSYILPSKCDYYIPKGSWKSYSKNIPVNKAVREEYWNHKVLKDATITGSVFEVEGDVVWTEIVDDVPLNCITFYDDDADGVLDYLCETHEDGGLYYDTFQSRYGDVKREVAATQKGHDQAVVSNGNGDLLLINVEDFGGKIAYIGDIDNDGRKDLTEKFSESDERFTIHFQQPDGTFLPIEQSAVMDDEAAAAHASSGGGGGIRPFSDGMMVKMPKKRTTVTNDDTESAKPVGDSYSFETQLCTALDMNEDGILDIINNGKPVLYSYADNKYFIGTSSRALFPCDLDGDGELDYICYNGNDIILRTRESGTNYSEKTLFSNKNVKQIIFKDFDHDGDLDILAYIVDSSNTYFVFFRNDGELSFKKRERNFATTYLLEDIKDVDADGLYEMMVYDSNNKQTKLLRIGTDLSVTEDAIDLSDRYVGYNYYKLGGADYPITIGDFDNNGRIEFRYVTRSSDYERYFVKYGICSQTVNTAPNKMATPTAVMTPDTGRLRINWKQGTDKETSACDLTYELRIGTQPASGNVLFGASLADGTRRLLDEGNMGHALSTLFNANSLKPGTYYISVQAIDGGGRGGAWSDDFVYEHQLTAPVIVSNFTNQMTTADTLLLSVKTPLEGAAYEWKLNEGKQIESKDGFIRYVFEHDGNHTINLTMNIDGRTMNAEPVTVSVDPAKKVAYIGNHPGYVDLNQDGYPEVLGKVNNGTGKFDDVLLSYVTDIPTEDYYKRHYVDYDLDGYPDVIVNQKVYINTGEQDNDFDVETLTIKKDGLNEPLYDQQTWFDANNDGIFENDGYSNDGTYANWTSFMNIIKPAFKGWTYLSALIPYDVNRDGMMDWIIIGAKNSIHDWKIYVMYKDPTAELNYSEPQELFQVDESMVLDKYEIEDINNDGYPDLILYNSPTLTIVKGSATLPCAESVSIDLPVKTEYYGVIRDYNNDGYLDIIWGYYLVTFGADFSVHFHPISSDFYATEYKYFMVQKDGGYPDGNASNIKNLPPSAPATVAAKQTKDGLLITWSDATDDHTPAMQMRYNVSVKRKGKKGAGSFVISPMNGLIDKATICGSVMYKKSTQMLVPAAVLTAGETYEIQVQAIDLWNQHSPMTKAVEFTMTTDGYIDMAEQVAVGKETTVKFVGTAASSYSLNAGKDGTIVKDNGNGSYVVKWTSDGVKEVALTAGSTAVKSAITVVKPIDLTFSVPAQVFANAPLTINVSDEMATEPKDVGMRIINNKVNVEYTIGSKTATVTFPSVGTYEIEAYCDDAVRGNSYKRIVNVTAVMPTAAITKADADSETGFYAVSWDATALPAGISKVIVSKEGSMLGAFAEIATVEANSGRFIDQSSTPAVQASRYSIQLLADNGQVSEVSTAHKPLHVMIAKATKGYNLIWDSYEGFTVNTYHIMRGSSPDNLTQIAQVAGSIGNYTDNSAPAGTSYYAVTFDAAPTTHGARRTSGSESIMSNLISTEAAVNLLEAESLEIIVLDEEDKLTDDHVDLQLYYLILPTYTTISKVRWEIVEGNDLATIDTNGKLHATGGTGSVKVRVTTLDGSDLIDEITIQADVKNQSNGIRDITMASDTEATLKDTRYYSLDGKQLKSPASGTICIEWRIYSNGQIMTRKIMKK